jgi:hypothetical protein
MKTFCILLRNFIYLIWWRWIVKEPNVIDDDDDDDLFNFLLLVCKYQLFMCII